MDHTNEHVSEQVMEALLSELTVYALKSCSSQAAGGGGPNSIGGTNASIRRVSVAGAPKIQQQQSALLSSSSAAAAAAAAFDQQAEQDPLDYSTADAAAIGVASSEAASVLDEQERTVASEMSAAKLERIGYGVGYRLTERLAQHKTWNSLISQDPAAQTAAQQLEAVKFLCKEIWQSIFGKQIDKLQTNHRGVFVLKDLNMKWLSSFPSGSEISRVKAIQLLAFPCGFIRGCLSDLGIPAVVSCDFLSDGTKMSACSFNIKVK